MRLGDGWIRNAPPFGDAALDACARPRKKERHRRAVREAP